MKSFIHGSLWGLVVGGMGLGFASLVNEQPVFAPGPAAPQLAAPQLGAVETSPTIALEVPVDEAPTFAPVAPLSVVTETPEAAPEVVTEPAALPQTAQVDPVVDAPDATDDPVLESAVDAPIPQQDTTELALAVPEDEVVVEADTPTAELAPVEDPQEPLITISEEPFVQDAPAVVVQTTPQEPAVTEDVTPTPDLMPEPAPEAVVVEQPPAEEPEVQQLEQEAIVADADAPAAITPALPQTNTEVRINRIGVDTAEEDVATDALAEDVLPDDRSALQRFAATFENPDDLPLISVVLLDTGAADVEPSALANLGFSPTIAINALSPDAEDAMTAYRAAGLEVAIQADLPDGAQPADVEVAFEAAFAQLPEVAMLFSNGTGALQERAVTAQVLEILAADGRGFVTVQRGLGNAARTAEQEGIPAAPVLRDLDGAGEDSGAISRALDQAAFRARQSGDAVLLGRLTPQTIEALRDWAADLDRNALAIAPVSAVLLKQVN